LRPDDTEANSADCEQHNWDLAAGPSGRPAHSGTVEKGGFDESTLAPVRNLFLQQLVALSRGQLRQSVVDDLVSRANVGVVPTKDSEETMVWQERVTPGRFDGRTVIVSGAASGHRMGHRFPSGVKAGEGGRVIAVDISTNRLYDLVASLSNIDIVTVAGDITQQADINRIVGTAGSRIDGLANVAGVNDDFSPAHETSDAIWDRVLGINLTGAFKLARAVIPAMLAAGRGAIVNVTSEAGVAW
jgi:short chain dehydrogenase